MPVSIGSELKLENNKVNAYYDNLFRKLNVAKAWTNTTTTESGGTVSVITGDMQIISNISSGYNDFCEGNYSPVKICIIDNKLYGFSNGSISQIGEKTDWKICSSQYLVIDSQNKLYHYDGSTISEIGSGIAWSYVADNIWTRYAIGDNKLYQINGNTPTQIGTEVGWTKLTDTFATYNTISGLCDGYVYYVSGNTATLMSAYNNFIDVQSNNVSTNANLLALNSNGEIFTNNGTTLQKITFNYGSIKQISNGLDSKFSVITDDGKLYYMSNLSDSNPLIKQIDGTKNWTYTLSCKSGSAIVAIGDGKLYYINDGSSNNPTITQIGSISGYKKIKGSLTTSASSGLALAWTGNATHTETTVYTTQNPIANDKAYSDVNLTEYSTVQSCDGSTLTDEYRTYEADIAKNSSFTNIPPATVHETIKAIDILRATE